MPINLFPSTLRSPSFFVRLPVAKYLLSEQYDEWRWHSLGNVTIINKHILSSHSVRDKFFMICLYFMVQNMLKYI